jgi:hypothetical protein
MTLSFLPTAVKAAMALSICSGVWTAESCTLMRAYARTNNKQTRGETLEL